MNDGAPAPVADLLQRWRIIEMDAWDQDAVDLLGPGFIEFAPDGHGQFGVVAVQGWLDCRTARYDGRPGVEFSWEGVDEDDPASGRGWAKLVDDTTLEGHLFRHLGDDTSFRARPFTDADDLEA